MDTQFLQSFVMVVDCGSMAEAARRLDLTRNDDPVKIERDLMAILPGERWVLFSHQLIHHGRALCQARKPICPKAAATMSRVNRVTKSA